MDEQTVTDDQLRSARDSLNAMIDAKLAGQPMTMAAGDDGKPVVGSLIGVILIGLGVSKLVDVVTK